MSFPLNCPAYLLRDHAIYIIASTRHRCPMKRAIVYTLWERTIFYRRDRLLTPGHRWYVYPRTQHLRVPRNILRRVFPHQREWVSQSGGSQWWLYECSPWVHIRTVVRSAVCTPRVRLDWICVCSATRTIPKEEQCGSHNLLADSSMKSFR